MSPYNRHWIIIAFAAAIGAEACAAGPPASSAAPVASTIRRDIRSLTILPGSAHACPGDIVSARYVAGLADGSRVALSREEVASLTLTGLAAQPRSDGAWKTSPNPMASIADGFRLSASLGAKNGSDSLVHGDTVVVPTYDCLRLTPIELRPISRSEDNVKAYVRLGVLPTPFYDSIVVAVVEVDGRDPMVRVLGPKDMRPGAIRVDAPGSRGSRERRGNRAQTATPAPTAEMAKTVSLASLVHRPEKWTSSSKARQRGWLISSQ